MADEPEHIEQSYDSDLFADVKAAYSENAKAPEPPRAFASGVTSRAGS